MKKICYYEVLVPGCPCWKSNIKEEDKAYDEANAAFQSTGINHDIYAIHEDGSVTGLYDRNRRRYG